MKRAALLLLLFLALPARGIERDKLAHFGAGYLCQDVMERITKPLDRFGSIFLSGLTCTVVNGLVEFAGNQDSADLVATQAGIFTRIGVGIVLPLGGKK